MSMSDPFDLQRFVAAQERTIAEALAELAAGRKETHWMWYIFPQVRGLGFSDMSYRYGIASIEEARAYHSHTVLGPRIEAATRLLMKHAGKSPSDILGSPDDQKFRSCMTLFAEAAGAESVFAAALGRFFGGKGCGRTLDFLAARRPLPVQRAQGTAK